VVCHDREAGDFNTFICLDAMELSVRVPSRFQLSTDSFAPYRDAVDRVLGTDIDYAQIHKEYAENSEGTKRYSPARIIGVTRIR